jgi:hypothetical protein
MSRQIRVRGKPYPTIESAAAALPNSRWDHVIIVKTRVFLVRHTEVERLRKDGIEIRVVLTAGEQLSRSTDESDSAKEVSNTPSIPTVPLVGRLHAQGPTSASKRTNRVAVTLGILFGAFVVLAVGIKAYDEFGPINGPGRTELLVACEKFIQWFPAGRAAIQDELRGIAKSYPTSKAGRIARELAIKIGDYPERTLLDDFRHAARRCEAGTGR